MPKDVIVTWNVRNNPWQTSIPTRISFAAFQLAVKDFKAALEAAEGAEEIDIPAETLVLRQEPWNLSKDVARRLMWAGITAQALCALSNEEMFNEVASRLRGMTRTKGKYYSELLMAWRRIKGIEPQ